MSSGTSDDSPSNVTDDTTTTKPATSIPGLGGGPKAGGTPELHHQTPGKKVKTAEIAIQTCITTLSPITCYEVIDQLNTLQLAREAKYATDHGIDPSLFIDGNKRRTSTTRTNVNSTKTKNVLKKVYSEVICGNYDEHIEKNNSLTNRVSWTLQTLTDANDKLMCSLATANELISELQAKADTPRAPTAPLPEDSFLDASTPPFKPRSDNSLFSPIEPPVMSLPYHKLPGTPLGNLDYTEIENAFNFNCKFSTSREACYFGQYDYRYGRRKHKARPFEENEIC